MLKLIAYLVEQKSLALMGKLFDLGLIVGEDIKNLIVYKHTRYRVERKGMCRQQDMDDKLYDYVMVRRA